MNGRFEALPQILLALEAAAPILWLAVLTTAVVATITILAQPIYRTEESAATASDFPSTTRIIAFCFFFGLLGGYIGLGTGASRNPVVGLVVPAVLTLLGAAVAYIFNKTAVSASSVWEHLSVPSLLSLVFCCLLAELIGANARLNGEILSKNVELCQESYKVLQAPVCEKIVSRYLSGEKLVYNDTSKQVIQACFNWFSHGNPCSIVELTSGSTPH